MLMPREQEGCEGFRIPSAGRLRDNYTDGRRDLVSARYMVRSRCRDG